MCGDTRIGMPSLTRRRAIEGTAGWLTLLAGCTSGIPGVPGGDDHQQTGPDTAATHGGITVEILSHRRMTEMLSRDASGERCVDSVEDGMERVALDVRITGMDDVDVDRDPFEILEGTAVVCDGDSHDAQTIHHVATDDPTEDQFGVEFSVPAGADLSSCTVEVTWQGTSPSEEPFQLGLGREQSGELPEAYPRCRFLERRRTFEVRITGDDERLLFDADDIGFVGSVRERSSSFYITIRVADSAAETVASRMREVGALDQPDDATVRVMLEGEAITELGLSRDLARDIDSGEWDGGLVLVFGDRETAEGVRALLTGDDPER